MAARSHVQETNDRRLRPIYDYLDNGNNKMAIQQAEKLLRKHRDLHCAKVLKAIGLQRSGRQAEALVLGQEVALTEPADDSSLQALTILYRELHRPELVPPLYETAVKTCLPSEELQAHLFMAYARLGHFKKMQQAAMVLYKITPKNPYYFWAVMSLVMQALCASEGDPGKEMFLPLAERMISKLVKQGKVEAEAEVQLYLLVLDLLEKHDEALAVLEGPLGGKLCGELRAVDTRKAAILRKTGCWREANELARRVLEHSPDDWPSLQLFLDSSFHLMDCHRKTGEAETSCTPFALMEFLDSLEAPDRKSTSDNAGRPIRGPSLARLQLLWRLKQDGREEELGGMIDGVQLLRKYLWQFGARPCCLSDIKLYLGLIQQSQAQQFISTLLDSLPNDPAKETGMSNATLALSNTLPPGNKVKPPSNSSAFICPDDGIDQALDASSPHLADGKVLQCLSNGGFNASVKTEACNNLQCASDESSNNGTLPFGNLTPTHSHEELLSDNATSSSSTLSPISRDNPCSLAELTIKDTPFTARGSPLPKQSLPINKDAVRVLTAKDLPTNEMAAPTGIESPSVSTVTSPISSPSSITLPKVFPPFPRDLEALRRGECLAELARVLGLHLSLEADVRLKLAQTAALLFRHALTLDECLLHTDMRPGEGFCLLATHLVLDEWRESGQGRAIWRALGLLEWAVMQCPAAPQLRLAQLRLYGELGALSGSLAAYAALEPKHVQHESMGYLVMSQVPASGQFFTAGLVYSPLLKFHRAQHKETAEYIIQAFKFGSFAQVPEVVSFRERLSASLDLALARTELALLVTLMGITPQGNQSLQESIAMAMEGDRIPWDHLRDNRDFDISMNFEPNEQQPYPSDLSRSIETSRLWLRIRALTLRGVTIATSGVAKGSGSNMAVEVSGSAGGDAATADGIPAPLVVNGGGVEEASASLSALSSLLRELIAIYRLLEENQLEEKARENVVKQPVFLPADPPLRDFICSGTWRCHLEAFNLTHALLTLQNCGITHDESSIIQKEICGHFNALRDHFEDTCLACRGSLIDESLGPHDLRPQPGLLHRLAFAAETTCLVVVVMGLAVAMLRPQRSLLQRRRKKRKDPQVPQSVPALAGYQEFVVVLEAAVGKLLGIVGEHALGLGNVHYVPSPLLDQHQEEERANQKVVWENVRNSYSRSLEDIETILRKCLDTIKSHKL